MLYDTASITEYYRNLLLYQYNDKPKASATIEALSTCATIDLLANQVNDGFDLMSAIGKQLDTLGEYVGFGRRVEIDISRPFFKFDDYVSVVPELIGMTDYNDTSLNANSVFYLYIFSNTAFNDLDDTEYRPLLILKSILNSSRNTLEEINALLNDFFDNGILIFDQKDMTVSYLVNSDSARIASIAYQSGLLPKPMGVGVSGIFAMQDPKNLFIFADYSWDNGAREGYCTYENGFNDKIVLNYLNRIN